MRHRSTLILTAVCLLVSGNIQAQHYENTPVTISSTKVNVGGQMYYSHIVVARQTLFSICKAYEVTYQDLIDSNPTIDLQGGGLKVGQALLIPVKETPAVEKTVEKETTRQAAVQNEPETGKDYIEYTAQWYETMDAIAKKFNISKEVLMAFNGMKADKILRRQIIRIPVHPEKVKVSSDAEVSATAPAEAATPAAPQSKEEPAKAAVQEEQPAAQPQEEPQNTIEQAIQSGIETLDNLAREAGNRLRSLFNKKSQTSVVKLGVLLPLNAKANGNSSALDLYSGILLAAKDLAETGIKSDITTIDIKDPAISLTSEKLEGFDMVIGPVSPENLEQVLQICGSDTPVISPLDPKAVNLAASHSNFIHAPSPVDAQYKDIIDWIAEDYSAGDKVLVITEKGAKEHPFISAINGSEPSFEYSVFTYGILESSSAAGKIQGMFTNNGVNRAVIASDNEAFVNDALRNLNLMRYRDLDVVLYAPSKIKNYETIEPEHLHDVNAHISCSYFIDYNNGRTKNFLMAYRALFGTEPTPFAYQGYDAAYYFIRNFATAENMTDRLGRLEIRKFRGLQSDFLLETDDEWNHGYVNHGIRRVLYNPDYSIVLTN